MASVEKCIFDLKVVELLPQSRDPKIPLTSIKVRDTTRKLQSVSPTNILFLLKKGENHFYIRTSRIRFIMMTMMMRREIKIIDVDHLSNRILSFKKFQTKTKQSVSRSFPFILK